MCDHEDLYRGIYTPLDQNLNDAEIDEAAKTSGLPEYIIRQLSDNVKLIEFCRARGESVLKEQKFP